LTRDRVEYEGQESKLADQIQAGIEEQAGPGIFSGGKQIVRTVNHNDLLMFVFNDGSAMRIRGTFKVDYAQPNTFDPTTGEPLELPSG